MWVTIQSELEAIDERFVDAVIAVSGLCRVLVLDTWLGVDKETGEELPPDHGPDADIYIEWRRWPGRYGLEVSIFGRIFLVEPRMSEMEFIRRLARALKRPFLESGGGPNPWSYYHIDQDGAVYHVHTTVPDDYPDYTDDDEVFDLDCDLDHDDPGYQPAKLICSATEAWK